MAMEFLDEGGTLLSHSNPPPPRL